MTLQLAQEWSIYPEDLIRRRGSAKWYARWAAWQEAIERNRKAEAQALERQARMNKR